MPKGVYDRSKAQPRVKRTNTAVDSPAEEVTETPSGRKPPGYWDTHGGPKEKNRQAWQKRKDKLAAQGKNTEGKPLKKTTKKGSAGAKALSTILDLGPPKPEGTFVRNGQTQPKVEAKAEDKGDVVPLQQIEPGKYTCEPTDPISKLVTPSHVPADALVRIIDGIQPQHLEELDRAIVENTRRGEALKLMRDVVAVKCGQPAAAPPPPPPPPTPSPSPVKKLPEPPKQERPKRKYQRRDKPPEGTTENNKPYVRPQSSTEHMKVPEPEAIAPAEPEKMDDKPLTTEEVMVIAMKRRMVVEYLAEVGNEETRPVFLMGECVIKSKRILDKVLDHPWFRKDIGGVKLSDQGLTVSVTKEFTSPIEQPQESAEIA